MYAAHETLIQHLDEHDVKYMVNSDDHSVYMNLYGTVGTYQIVARVDDGAGLFLVCGRLPVRAPAGAVPAIAETITRANFELLNGRFEMDFDTGDLQFQIAEILSGVSLDEEVIERMIRTTLRMLDTYMPAVLSVIYGNEQPRDAVYHVEEPPCDDECPPDVDDARPF
jgi:hypothetical protein